METYFSYFVFVSNFERAWNGRRATKLFILLQYIHLTSVHRASRIIRSGAHKMRDAYSKNVVLVQRDNYGREIALICGIFIGFLLAVVLQSSFCDTIGSVQNIEFTDIRDRQAFLTMNLTNVSDITANSSTEITPIHEMLKNDIRVLCWILTDPENHKTKAIHVKQTWGQRCTKLLFMSTEHGSYCSPCYWLLVFVFFSSLYT